MVFIRRREANACLIMLSTKQGSHWYHFQRLWYGAAGARTHDLPIPKQSYKHVKTELYKCIRCRYFYRINIDTCCSLEGLIEDRFHQMRNPRKILNLVTSYLLHATRLYGFSTINEPRYEKTSFLHIRKQRRRSPSRN